jgi:hypothetical protein
VYPLFRVVRMRFRLGFLKWELLVYPLFRVVRMRFRLGFLKWEQLLEWDHVLI